MTERALTIAFFGHDALESTVVKRAQAFAAQGCELTGFMFDRPREGLRPRLGCPLVHLGTTRDRGYLARLPRLAAGLARAWRARDTLQRADVFYARNLDMLLLASAARLCSGSRASLVYEVLDIQRPMLRADLWGRGLRWVEGRLLDGCALLVVSSPAFISRYFAPIQNFDREWMLLENKLPAGAPGRPIASEPRPPGPPWIIGWFGTLRCRRSLRALCDLADAMGQAVEVVLAGRPSPADFAEGEVEAEAARRANVTYIGAYESPADLPALYGPVHFAWCIDYTDDGANSDWLIPNRIYEGGFQGAVALGRRATVAGQLIESRGLGLGLAEPVESTARAALKRLTAADYGALRERLERMPRGTFVDEGDTAALVARLKAPSDAPRPRVRSHPGVGAADLGRGPDPRGAVEAAGRASGATAPPPSAGALVGAAAAERAEAAGCHGPAGAIRRVAVVIPYFQRDAGILGRALRSVAQQRFGRPVDIEVIVVDDASPCAPEPELEGLSPALSVRIVRRANGGPAAARNTGLDSLSEGVDAVAFLDSDDVWRPDHLDTALRMLGADCDFYFCDHLRPDGASSHFASVEREAGDLLGSAEVRHATGGAHDAAQGARSSDRHLIGCADALDAFIVEYWAHTSCIVYRTARMPGLRFDATLRSAGEDYLFTLNLMVAARQVCFSRRIHVERGFGVNLYDSATGWNHPNNLRLVFDNFRCFLRAAQALSAQNSAVPLIRRRVDSLRIKFIWVFLRKIVVLRTLDRDILSAAWAEDRSLLLHLPHVILIVGIKRALRIPVPELI